MSLVLRKYLSMTLETRNFVMPKNSGLTQELKELTYRIVFEESKELKFIIDRDGKILNANNVFTTLIGKTLEDCLGMNAFLFTEGNIAEERRKQTNKAFRTGQRIIFEDESNGRCFRNTLYPIAAEDGKIDKLFVSTQDVTDITRQEKRSKQHSAFSREAMEAIPGPFVVLDSMGFIITCNSLFRKIIARNDDNDLAGINTFDLFHPDDKALAYEKLDRILRKGNEESDEIRILTNGGPEFRWFRISTKRIIVDNELFLVSSGIDIEEYKNKEKELTIGNEQLRFILSESCTGSWEWDMKTNSNKWSDEIWRLYGLEKNSCEPSYENWKKSIIEDDRENIEQQVFEASKKGIPFRIEWRVLYADGSLHWLMSRGIPFMDTDGGVSRYIGIVIDISDLKEAENALRKSEERFRRFFEQHSALMMILDPETGNIIDVNNSTAEFYGWSREQLRHMTVTEMNIEKPEYSLKRLVGWRYAEKRTFPVTHRKADGSICDLEVFGRKVKVNERWLAYLILQDITDRKRFQHALVETNERLRLILKATNAGVWETDLDTNESSWSDEIWRLNGLEPCNSKPSFENWINTIVPEDRAMVKRVVAEAINNAAEYNCSWRVRSSDGTIHWLMSKGNPIRDANGIIVKYAGITLDITERKREEEERQRLESHLRKSQRLETIGTLAGGIAHDFNNLLTPILGYAELGTMSLSKEEATHQYFSEIMLAAERAQQLVAQIMTFSKTQESDPVVVSVQAVILEALKLIRPLIPATITIEQHIEFCRNIFADSSKLHQVILNLCTNAFHAMEQSGGVLTIDLRQVTLDPGMLKLFQNLDAESYVKLTISDTGCGMDEKIMEHIFEPFFTTKPDNKGTGLGLSVVHGIIKSFKGEITVESQPGKGTSLGIYLPVIDKIITRKEKKKVVTGEKASVLFVDDEEATVKMMTMMLTKLGYRIHALNSPQKALELFRQTPGEFDLLIADLTMPEMTGIKLATEIHSCRPELPVILMTGYGKDIDSNEKLEKYGINWLLKKPIKVENLVSAINEVLSGNEQ